MNAIAGLYPTTPPPGDGRFRVWPYSCYHHVDKWHIVNCADDLHAIVEDTFLALDNEERTDGKTGAQEIAEHIVDLLNADYFRAMEAAEL